MRPDDVLDFWFSERARALWFERLDEFDHEIRTRFAAVVDASGTGQLDHWAASAAGSLAPVVALDQFPRNMHRGSPRAFEHDHKARAIARAAVDAGFDMAVELDRRLFFYLPFEHSEDLADQDLSVALFRRWADEHPPSGRADADDQMLYVHRHREIIQRFGRFPHRNTILGRPSTPAEIAFLTEPLSSF